jgi:phosphoglycerol transferase MdoB-like AlkP superfamily enzyme
MTRTRRFSHKFVVHCDARMQPMKSSFIYYLKYILFLLGIQLLFRIIFMIIYRNQVQGIDLVVFISALAHGMKMDLSLTGYCLLLPTVLLFFASLVKKLPIRPLLDGYTLILLLLLVPLFFTNLVIYRYWNFPIDKSIFDYLNTPGEMFASLHPFKLVLLILLIFLFIWFLYSVIYRHYISRPFKAGQERTWMEPLIYFLLVPSLILPIRGGLQTAPINTGSVYFHREAFVNHAAVNPVWNLIYTLTETRKLSQSVNYMSDAEAREIFEGLHDHDQHPFPVLNTASPNIIIILLESFALDVINELSGDLTAAPNFNSLIPEGIYFDRMYASGTMTDRALGSILSGYPGIPGTCVIYYEQKTENIPNLNRTLRAEGYGSAFLYGGDIDFAHIRSFMLSGGVRKIISDQDFDRSVPRSNWGVPDHLMFQRLLEETDSSSTPFLNILLTLSSHSPFDVPMETVFPGNDIQNLYLNSIYYTDGALGDFIREAKTRDWWDETLLVLVADHGCRIGKISEHEEKRFRIPMLWLGGALAVRDTVISNYGSQTDLPYTLLGQLGLPRENFIFSNDLLSENHHSFAYYSFHDGIGFISDSLYTVYSLTTDSLIIAPDPVAAWERKQSLAYLQYLLNVFNKL